jgi:hypothetical protein
LAPKQLVEIIVDFFDRTVDQTDQWWYFLDHPEVSPDN